jgi:hypothetical protein
MAAMGDSGDHSHTVAPSTCFSEGLSYRKRIWLSPLPVSLPGERLIMITNAMRFSRAPSRAGGDTVT